MPGGGCRQRGVHRDRVRREERSGDPREGQAGSGWASSPPAAARSGSAAAVRACAGARPPGMPQSRAEGAGQRHRGHKRSPPRPPARSGRPSIPRARGEMLPVPPPCPTAADPPTAPAAPRCVPSPAAAPGPAACGALRGGRCLPAGAVRCCPLPAGLPALSGAARRAVGAALPQSGQGWAGGPSEWGPGGVTEARPPALRRGAVRGGPASAGLGRPRPGQGARTDAEGAVRPRYVPQEGRHILIAMGTSFCGRAASPHPPRQRGRCFAGKGGWSGRGKGAWRGLC